MKRSNGKAIVLAATAACALFTMPAAAASVSVTALQEGVQDQASSDRRLKSFYAARGNRPIWFVAGRPSTPARNLLELLESADLDGLDPDDYRSERLRKFVEAAAAGDENELARADVALSVALLDYARDLRRKTKSDMVYVDKPLRPTPPDAADQLQAAAAGGPMERILQMHPLYVQLRSAYSSWRNRWSSAPDIAVAKGPTLSAGAKGERVRQLRARLGLPEGTVFDARLAGAVRSFKEAHGLAPTGVVDASTVAALNEGRALTEARIRLNLARVRHLPGPDVGRHLVVDAAGQRLMLYDGARLLDSMRVIVGKPSEPTPMMAAYIRYTAVNPYWNVPPDLVASRVAQNVLAHGLGYLNDKGYEILSGWSPRAEVLDPATIDWQAVAAGRQDLPVRQRPGPGNMMGAMKFMFPNKFGVYLHDTPEKILFKEADRRRSSGCVRVEDAPRLARWLYGHVPAAPTQTREYNVPLPEPVPVFITYLTAVPSQSGIAFREDVYGRDRLSTARLVVADQDAAAARVRLSAKSSRSVDEP